MGSACRRNMRVVEEWVVCDGADSCGVARMSHRLEWWSRMHWGLQLLLFHYHSTDSISILLRRQTRSAFVRNYIRLIRRLIHSSIATKASNTIPKHVSFLKRSRISRSFHSSPVDNRPLLQGCLQQRDAAKWRVVDWYSMQNGTTGTIILRLKGATLRSWGPFSGSGTITFPDDHLPVKIFTMVSGVIFLSTH